MRDTTTVRINLSGLDEARFVEGIGSPPELRLERPRGLVELRFEDWNMPGCIDFHVDGIPWFGSHGHGEGFEPHRMCGSGDDCQEIYADREAHLYVVVDDASGSPNRHSAEAVADYLHFEQHCRRLAEDRTTEETGRASRI